MPKKNGDNAEDLRRVIKRCCDEADAAGQLALRALRAVEREGRRRADQVRELRSRLASVEARVTNPRTR
ncbi:MAG: hypothetical protein LC640_08995 [Frankia sp.]|nr:hypothetical protein [Frankia sp.]